MIDPVVNVGMPALVALSMGAVGLELTLGDFRRVARMPRAVLLGVAGQIVLMPPLAAAIARVLELPPVVAAAVMIFAACPMAAAASLYVSLARASVGLSVTLAGVSALAGTLAMPLAATFGLNVLLGDPGGVAVPVLRTMVQLLGLLVAPIGVGMTLGALRPDTARRWGPGLRIATLTAIAVAAAWVTAREWTAVRPLAGSVLLAAVVLLGVSGGAGWLVGLLASPLRADRFAISMGQASRSFGVAAVVGAGVLPASTMLAVVVLMLVVHTVMATAAAMLFRRGAADADQNLSPITK